MSILLRVGLSVAQSMENWVWLCTEKNNCPSVIHDKWQQQLFLFRSFSQLKKAGNKLNIHFISDYDLLDTECYSLVEHTLFSIHGVNFRLNQVRLVGDTKLTVGLKSV